MPQPVTSALNLFVRSSFVMSPLKSKSWTTFRLARTGDGTPLARTRLNTRVFAANDD